MNTKLITYIVVAVVIGIGIIYMISRPTEVPPDLLDVEKPADVTSGTEGSGVGTSSVKKDEAVVSDERGSTTRIGDSVEGRPITAYHFGTGEKEVLFLGGIHGGYSWNTANVAYELIEYLRENPSAVPPKVTVTVIPVLNPDGLVSVAGKYEGITRADVPQALESRVSSRFNAHTVDINRNFDCEWQEQATWQNRTVSGGSAPFSEPESRAIRDYVLQSDPAAAVVWYSAYGGVFSSNCRNGVSAETKALTQTFAKASGYPAYEEFDFYEITGDMVNWFAKNDIPGISVLLADHEATDWLKNKAGIDALLAYIAK